MASKYWYGGANSVLSLSGLGRINVRGSSGSLTPKEAREFAIALLEAANDVEVVEISEQPPYPPDGHCEDCRGDHEDEDDAGSLSLYSGLYGTFWACGHCYDTRTLEE